MALVNRITEFSSAHLCILNCVPVIQRQVIFHHHIFGPLYPLLPPSPFPSSNHHTVVCVYESQFYIPHRSEIIWFVAFSDSLISLSKILSRSIHVVTNGSIYFFLEILFIFREGLEGRRKRGRETSMCCCLLCAPYWGPGLQPRHVPWLGIEPVTLWFADQYSIYWATPARAKMCRILPQGRAGRLTA